MLHTISLVVSIAGAVGVVGLIVLFFAAPVIFEVVVTTLERVLGRLASTRPGCVALALVVAVPCAYGIGSHDRAALDRAAAAEAAAAFNLKLAGAARVAATRDQARAAAAEAARAQAEERAHALVAKIPKTACLDADAAGALVRGVWPAAGAARKPRAAGAARRIEDLLRRH